jgi:hypothetical protein
VNQPEAKPPRPEAVKARSRRRSMTAPAPLKAGSSRSTPQRASPSAASQVAWNVRPTVWPRTWASERTSATKASRPRRIWPMAPAAHQHALARIGPVHPPDLDLRVVPAAVEDVGLGDPVRGQHALGILRIDRQVRARADLGGRQPALGLEVRAVEAQRPVMVGEAEGDAIGPRDPPAPGERGRAVVEMACRAGSRVFIGAVPEAEWR